MLVPKPKSNPRAVPECTSVRQPGFGWPFQKGGAPDGGRSWRGADRLTEKETSQQKKLKPGERSFWQMGWLRSGGFSAPASRQGFHDVRADCWGGGPQFCSFLVTALAAVRQHRETDDRADLSESESACWFAGMLLAGSINTWSD